MKAEVVFTSDFRADLRAQTRRLVFEEKREWAEMLIEEIQAVRARQTRRQIRRLVMRRLPFVVWYHFRARSKKVVVLRLFHVRQRR